jgi:glycosyltransferase involved in cell wall biosynthesis
MRAVNDQSYKNIEMIVVDSQSTDDTARVARNFGAFVIESEHKLFGARYEGIMASKGEYVLLLDSDQILYPDTIDRLLMGMRDYDMMCLEEEPYLGSSFTQMLFKADSRVTNENTELHLDPMEGAMTARFYETSLLRKALQKIDINKLSDAAAHDHAIIYYEAYKLSQKVGVLRKAVMHDKPSTFRELWQRNYRAGQTTKLMIQSGLYPDLLRKTTRSRKRMSLSSDSIKSMLLRFMKGLPYTLGMLNPGPDEAPRKSRRSVQPDLWYSYS